MDGGGNGLSVDELSVFRILVYQMFRTDNKTYVFEALGTTDEEGAKYSVWIQKVVIRLWRVLARKRSIIIWQREAQEKPWRL